MTFVHGGVKYLPKATTGENVGKYFFWNDFSPFSACLSTTFQVRTVAAYWAGDTPRPAGTQFVPSHQEDRMLNLHRYQDYTQLLKATRTIAIVGLSPKEARPSNMVARYLIEAGFTIIPVNPGQSMILGLPCFSRLTEIGESVDMVNIFRRAEDVLPVVEDAIAIGAKSIWMQQGIINHEAAALAEQHGLQVVMDRCVKIDHIASFPVAG